MSDTIFAQATPPGRAGIAVIRVSGPEAHAALSSLAGVPIPPRRATLRSLRDPRSGESIDDAILLHFPAPASFTGETVVEVQCHGSPAVCRRLLAVLSSFKGLRLADPGEFTRRALENGRLDLPQVEALADLLAAETEAQRRQALAVASGAVSGIVDRWRTGLVKALALIEAVIDFGEDGVPTTAIAAASDGIRRVAAEIDAMLAGSAAAERIRNGYTVAICGAPNVGKSTLLNAIAGREVALTSAVAGTTRDVIEVQLDLRGLPVTLLDTAGLRDSDDAVERLGIERARARASAADVRVVLVDAADCVYEKHMHEEDILIRGKADLTGNPVSSGVSGLTGQGVEELLGRIANVLTERASGATLLSHERQVKAATSAAGSLARCTPLLEETGDVLELASYELQGAIRSLDMLSGKVDVETMLDHVFRTFCLGK